MNACVTTSCVSTAAIFQRLKSALDGSITSPSDKPSVAKLDCAALSAKNCAVTIVCSAKFVSIKPAVSKGGTAISITSPTLTPVRAGFNVAGTVFASINACVTILCDMPGFASINACVTSRGTLMGTSCVLVTKPSPPALTALSSTSPSPSASIAFDVMKP